MDILILKILYVILALSLIVKSYLQTFLAYRNKVENYGTISSFKNLWYFNYEVAMEDKAIKRICNMMQTIHMFLFCGIILFNIVM
jgi:hypothetical protein